MSTLNSSKRISHFQRSNSSYVKMLEENFQNKIQGGYKILCSCSTVVSNKTKNEGLNFWSDDASPSIYGMSFLFFFFLTVEILCMADLWVWLLLSTDGSVCVNTLQANCYI